MVPSSMAKNGVGFRILCSLNELVSKKWLCAVNGLVHPGQGWNSVFKSGLRVSHLNMVYGLVVVSADFCLGKAAGCTIQDFTVHFCLFFLANCVSWPWLFLPQVFDSITSMLPYIVKLICYIFSEFSPNLTVHKSLHMLTTYLSYIPALVDLVFLRWQRALEFPH